MTKSDVDIAGPIIQAAAQVAESVSARILFAYAGAVNDLAALKDAVHPPTKLVLVCRDTQEQQRAKDQSIDTMIVPAFNLTRMGQIKMATMLAFSKQKLSAGDVFVFLSGLSGQAVDTIVTMRIGDEYELFQSVGQPELTEHIRPAVFERVLTIALELAYEGREGKPVGAVFVLGDYRDVQKYCQEGRINPFKGYTEKQRNIVDDSMRDTVKEIAKLDGAFIIKGTGVIVSGCTTLRPAIAGEPMTQELGSRHAAAAAITASTKCLAITLSESTGTVRVWRRGALITEIEKSAPRVLGGGQPPATS
ncbi:MAG: DNA integrity scanning protein DisA nucleotide-binding domain protein [Planctomycetes bacterium]|nr:DNA integrity scanning protein DisA nucleotide-binding domain protein [Planctomycetota bacterium]